MQSHYQSKRCLQQQSPGARWLVACGLAALLLQGCGGGSGPDFKLTVPSSPNAFVQRSGQGVTGVKISEVSACALYSVDCWIEVYNANSSAVSLQDYQLLAWSKDMASGTVSQTPTPFDLPPISVPSKGYAVIAGYTAAGSPPALTSTPLAWVKTSAGAVPYWGGSGSSSGFFEIVRKQGNASEDVVLLGAATQTPTGAGGAWTMPAFAALSSASVMNSMVRSADAIHLSDKDSAEDWTPVDRSTPGAPNDFASGQRVEADLLPTSRFGGLDIDAGSAAATRARFLLVLQTNGYLPSAVTPPAREVALQAIIDQLPHQ